MFRNLISPVIVLFSLCLLFGTTVASNASKIGANAYFGQNGNITLCFQTSVNLTGTTVNDRNYMYISTGKMNTSAKYQSAQNIAVSDNGYSTVVKSTTIGYGYSLPYLGYVLPFDAVLVTYILSIPHNGSVPTISVTVSSYDHPTLPPFYHADLTLIRGGVAVLP